MEHSGLELESTKMHVSFDGKSRGGKEVKWRVMEAA